MSRKFFVVILCCLVAASFVTTSTATDRAWTPTGNSSNDFAVSGNWNPTPNPGSGDRGLITNNSASANQTNIAYVGINYDIFGGTGDGVVVSNSNASGSGINKLLQNSNHFQMHQLTVGNNGIVEIVNGASISAYRGATLTSGGSLILNSGTFRFNGEDRPNFLVDGTVVGNSGTLILNPFDDRNNGLNVRSGGRIIANSGTLWVSTRSATSSFNGMTVDSGGTIQVNNGATFVLDRNGGAWDGGTVPQNNGNINLNGGTFTVTYNSGQAVDRPIQNNGTILGSGTLAMRVNQSSTGATIASNGVLNIFQTIAGNQQSFTSVGGDFGTFKAVNGGTMKVNGNVASGMGGAWIVDSGGTLEISSGNGVDLGSAFIPGSGLNGTVVVRSGANLTMSGNTGIGGQTVRQSGTFLFDGGTISMPNVSGLNRFTNTASGVFLGNGVFRTGYGPANNNYGILNLGSVIASNGVLTMYADDADDVGGFQNQGTVRILNGATLTVTRSDNAWITGVLASPTNLNWISMEGGTLRGSNTSVGVLAGKLVNAAGGSISGGGAFTGFTTYENDGSIIANDSSTPLSWIKVTPASDPLFLVNRSGGVISANTARVIVNGVFTNQAGGTFAMINGVGTFNGAVVNAGAWITDPTTNAFNDTLTVTSSGFISAAAGDVYIFKSNLVNQSTQSNTWKTLSSSGFGGGGAPPPPSSLPPGGQVNGGTKFIFDGTNTTSSSTYTQLFYTAGLKLTGGFVGTPSSVTETQNVSSYPAVSGFTNNFALDRLELGNLGTNSILKLADTFGTVQPSDGNEAALFVVDLWIFGNSQLIISNNTVLYFVNSNSWSAANITLLGNAEIHQLTLFQAASVPEPSVLLLWVSGIATLYGARRRQKKIGKR